MIQKLYKKPRLEFGDKSELLACINCETEQEAIDLLSLLDSRGFKWASFEPLTKYTMWEAVREKTVYSIDSDGFVTKPEIDGVTTVGYVKLYKYSDVKDVI